MRNCQQFSYLFLCWGLLRVTAGFFVASSVALSKLDRYKKTFPEDFSPVKSGGWYNLQQLAENPKEKFVEFVVEGLKQTESSDATEISVDEPKLEALVNLLYASAKGFEADLVDGDWVLVFSQNGDKVTKFASIDKESGDSVVDNVFDIKTMTFSNIATISKRAVMMSRGKYSPLSKGYTKTADGKIVLRQVASVRTAARFKFSKLPKIIIPQLWLPFIRRGELEFVYMDKDIRVTKNKRGGMFVHFRPDFLAERLA